MRECSLVTVEWQTRSDRIIDTSCTLRKCMDADGLDDPEITADMLKNLEDRLVKWKGSEFAFTCRCAETCGIVSDPKTADATRFKELLASFIKGTSYTKSAFRKAFLLSIQSHKKTLDTRNKALHELEGEHQRCFSAASRLCHTPLVEQAADMLRVEDPLPQYQYDPAEKAGIDAIFECFKACSKVTANWQTRSDHIADTLNTFSECTDADGAYSADMLRSVKSHFDDWQGTSLADTCRRIETCGIVSDAKTEDTRRFKELLESFLAGTSLTQTILRKGFLFLLQGKLQNLDSRHAALQCIESELEKISHNESCS